MINVAQRRLALDAAKTVGGLGAGQILTAVLYLVVARASEPSEFGSAMAAIGVGTFLAVLLDFGTVNLVIREVAAGHSAAADFARRYVTKLVLIFGCAAVYTAAMLLPKFSSVEPTWRALGLVTGLLAIAQISYAPLRAKADFARVSLSVVSDKGTGLAVIVGLVFLLHRSADFLWLALSAGSLVSALFSYRGWPDQFKAAVRASIRQPRTWRTNPWRGSLHFGLGSIFVAMGSLDVTVTSAVAGTHTAGTYAAVNRWVRPMGLVMSGYTQSAYPHVSEAKTNRAAWERAIHGRVLLVPLIFVVIAIAAAAQPLVLLLLGPEFHGSADALRLLALAMIPSFISQPLFMYLQARGRERWTSRVVSASVPTQLLLVALLAVIWGAVGAAAGYLFSQLASCIMLVALVRQHLRD